MSYHRRCSISRLLAHRLLLRSFQPLRRRTMRHLPLVRSRGAPCRSSVAHAHLLLAGYYAAPAQPTYYTPPPAPAAVTVVSSDPYGHHHHHHQAQVTSYTVSTTAPGAPPSTTAAGAATVTVVRGAHGGGAVITTAPAPAPAVVMTGPAAIDGLAFGGILHQLEHAPFQNDKRAVLETAWRSHYFTAQQIGDLVNHVPFAGTFLYRVSIQSRSQSINPARSLAHFGVS